MILLCRAFTWMVIHSLWSGWAMVNGQRTIGARIIDGMQYPAVLLRFLREAGQQS
nr:hypothetical protein Iba_scaffold16135CG0030 [Ipomoea batatas]